MSERITACLVVCNEEKLIGRCLASLASTVDEIIVAHDGICSDQTLSIAASYGAKIFVLPGRGNCDVHRPFVYRQARGWILRIDADEFLSAELKNNLRALVEDRSVDAYDFVWPFWDGRKRITHGWPYKRALFRRDRISFLGLPHFIPRVEGKIVRKNLVLEHQPTYDNYSFKVFRQKWLSWAKIQAACYLNDFEKIEKFNWAETAWSPQIRLRRKFPRLMILPDFATTFFNNLRQSRLIDLGVAIKIAFLFAAYRAAIDYHLYLIKRNKI